jgi:hypothetical protein
MLQYYFHKIRWYVGIALLLCLGITVMKYSAWIDRSLFGSFQQPPAAQQSPAASSSTTLGTASTSDSTDVRAQLSQANTLLSEASIYASKALKDVLTWQQDVEPLRSRTVSGPAVGDATTEESELIDRLAYLFREERSSSQTLRDASNRVETVRRKIDDLSQQASPAALTTSDMAEIRELHATCKAAAEDWELAVQRAVAIKHLMEKGDTPTEPQNLSAKLDDADARAAVADLDDEIEHGKDRKSEARMREANVVEQKRLQEEREAELLAKATSPEVKAILAPFLQARDLQPIMSGPSVRFRKTLDTKPMSLSALRRMNALSLSIDGLKRLAAVGGYRKLSQPRWSVNSQPGNWSDDEKQMLQEAQLALIEYGPLLVKAGLLSE